MSSQFLPNPSSLLPQKPSTFSDTIASTIQRLTFLLASLTVGSESSFSSSRIRDSFILNFSRSLVLTESTVSCRWIRRWNSSASEWTAAIVLKWVQMRWAR
ncbi:hypothetical protein ACFX2I_024644 [Malus domestica]